MKTGRYILAIILAVIHIFVFTACSAENTHISDSDGKYTGNTTADIMTGTSADSTTAEPSDSTRPHDTEPPDIIPDIGQEHNSVNNYVFTDEIRLSYPAELSSEERQQINAEVEELLSRKEYSDVAKTLVRDTVDAVISGQPEFQAMFGFLEPHGTEEFVLKYIIEPLDTMVDTLRCCGEETPDDLAWLYENYGDPPGFNGLTDEYNKEIIIVLGPDQNANTLFLLHELHHAVILREHDMFSSALYNELLEGGATIQQIAMTGSYYHTLGDLIVGSRGYIDPANDEYLIRFNGNGSFDYAYWGNKYFKLLALTDFDTMDLFAEPNGESKIRANLIERYGDEGGMFYDGLETVDSFYSAIENESRFLRLFTSRMDEAGTASELVSYYQLYRLYRRVFAAKYMYESYVEIDGSMELHEMEVAHPMLDYRTYDETMADALIKSGAVNTKGLTDEEARILSRILIVSPSPHDYTEYYQYRNILSNESFTDIRSKYIFEYAQSGDVSVRISSSDTEIEFCYSAVDERFYLPTIYY